MTREEVISGFRERMGDTLADDWVRRWGMLALPNELIYLEPEEFESALISAVPPFADSESWDGVSP